MRIEIRGRKANINDELKELVHRRFRTIAKQVPPPARLELEISEERNPAVAANKRKRASATLYLKGSTLHAKDTSYSIDHAIHLCQEELARQVDRYRHKHMNHRRFTSTQATKNTNLAL